MKKIVVITGPTASGKSQLAHTLAKEMASVIINCDSMQVYKEIPILSAQPTKQEQQEVEHRLYGISSLADDFSTGSWLEKAKIEIDEVLAANKTPILTGGTGMYIKSLMDGIAETPAIGREIKSAAKLKLEELGNEKFHEFLKTIDKAALEKIKPNDQQRMLRVYEVYLATGKSLTHWQKQEQKKYFNPEQFKIFYIQPERESLYGVINKRFLKMLEGGVLDEIKEVIDKGIIPTPNALKAHGLREIIAYLENKMQKAEMIESVQQQVRNYAKRQMTWIRNQYPEKILVSDWSQVMKNL